MTPGVNLLFVMANRFCQTLHAAMTSRYATNKSVIVAAASVILASDVWMISVFAATHHLYTDVSAVAHRFRLVMYVSMINRYASQKNGNFMTMRISQLNLSKEF